MKTRKKLIILVILFGASIANYTRISFGIEIRDVEFLSIFAIGAISSLLICEIISAIKNG